MILPARPPPRPSPATISGALSVVPPATPAAVWHGFFLRVALWRAPEQCLQCGNGVGQERWVASPLDCEAQGAVEWR